MNYTSSRRERPVRFFASWFDIQMGPNFPEGDSFLIRKTKNYTLSGSGKPKKKGNVNRPTERDDNDDWVPLDLTDFTSRFVNLPASLEDRRFIIGTMASLYRCYLRTLEVLFPDLRIRWQDFLFDSARVTSCQEFIDRWKLICLSPLSFALGNRKQLDFPFTGKPFQYIKKVLRRRSGSKFLVFSNTVLQIKNSALKVPSSFIKRELEKHASKMTREQNPLAKESNMDKDTFHELVYRQFAKFLNSRGQFQQMKFDPQADVENISMKSTIEVPQKQGGAYGYYNSYFAPGDDYDIAGNFRPVLTRIVASETGAILSRARLPLRQWQLTEELRSIQDDLERNVCAVTEPMKVRVITVHHASETTGYATFQKRAQKIISNREVTTGRVGDNSQEGPNCDFTDLDFQELREKLQRMQGIYGECVVVSDDASAATDSIDPDLSSRFVGALVDPEDPLYPCLTKWSGATINYPEKYGIESVTHSYGQLMGDRRSFPILCAIHRSAKHAFLHSFGFTKDLWFVRVNGDDGVILLPRGYVKAYFDWMGNLWKLNMNKTYVSNKVFSFNSVLWMVESGKKVDLIRHKLIDRFDKFGEKISNPIVWNRVADSIKNQSSEVQKKVWSYFAATWRDILRKVSDNGTNNWFLPLAAGGLGLTKPKGLEFKVTLLQKGAVKFAHDHIDEPTERRIASRIEPLKGSYSVPVQKFDFYSRGLSRNPTKLEPTIDPVLKKSRLDSLKSKLIPGKIAHCELFYGEVWGMVLELEKLKMNFIIPNYELNHAKETN